MDWIGQFVLILLIKIVSPAILNTTVIPLKNEEIKTSNTYQVTENIRDIPDNRTRPPIVPNFGVITPLNLGNNSLINTIDKNSNESSEGDSNESTEENNQIKKHSFSILHIKAEYDDKPVKVHQNALSKVFGGIKDYVYYLKRGVVDGLHNFFHQHDGGDKESEFHSSHRSFDGAADFGDDHDYDDDESIEHYGHY